MHRKHLAAATLVAALIVPAAAYASGEQANNRVLLGAASINQTNCRFLHRESDPATGPSWRNLRNYVLYEDLRHDRKMACLAHHMGQQGPRGATGKTGATGARGPAGPAGAPGSGGGVTGYVRVSAPINFKQATAVAVCPAGDVVLGGGATVEVAGSYPSSDGAWTVTRDSVWGHQKTGTVYAVCAKAAS